VPAALLKNALLMRHTRAVSGRFNVIFGVFNENDFGRRGIQYVHYPTYLRPRPRVDLRWYHGFAAGLEAYYRLADRLAGFSFERLKSNLTLVNSDWTGEHVGAFLGVPTETLYPPVVDPLPGRAWTDRRCAFLAVGRIAPEKEYERIMRILAGVRRRHALSLTIVGTTDRHSRGYRSMLDRVAASLGSWIEFRDNVTRDDLRELMASYRYGIHGMREEHFGMAPAEMARAGMIVWVPRGGGQVEIAGGEPTLMYDTDEDAVEKITRVLDAGAEQQRLRDHLATRSERFSTAHFQDHVRQIVDGFKG
jgi:glycosyltransferase involved in cell wall biosynthesis